MDHVTLKLSAGEKRIILLWYEYFRADSQHYGDGLAVFPQEQIVLRKLEQAETGEITFSIYDIETIKSWMDKSVKSKYSTDVYLTGEEGMVYDKITQLYKVCFPDQVT